jgi:hypothetical protein
MVFEYLLRIPFELARKFGIGEVVHDPVPHWTTPSLVFEFFALKIAGHHMSLKLDELFVRFGTSDKHHILTLVSNLLACSSELLRSL